MNYCTFPGKFTLSVVICEIGILILFGFFVRYDDYGMPKKDYVDRASNLSLNNSTNKSDQNPPEKQTDPNTKLGNKYEAHIEEYYPSKEEYLICCYLFLTMLISSII